MCMVVRACTYGDGGARSASAHRTRCRLVDRVLSPGVNNIPPVPIREILLLLPAVDIGH